MTEKNGSPYARNKLPEKAGLQFCLISKTDLLANFYCFIKIFNLTPSLKHVNKLRSEASIIYKLDTDSNIVYLEISIPKATGKVMPSVKERDTFSGITAFGHQHQAKQC